MGQLKPRATQGAGQARRPAATSPLKSLYASWIAWLRSVTCSSQVVPLMHDAPPRSGSFQYSDRWMPRFHFFEAQRV